MWILSTDTPDSTLEMYPSPGRKGFLLLEFLYGVFRFHLMSNEHDIHLSGAVIPPSLPDESVPKKYFSLF